jgi:hypothetical protein
MSDVYLASGAKALALHLLTLRYGAVAAAVAGYRLLAERQRRKTLLALASQAPVGTVVLVDKGPGGPAMWLTVGDGNQDVLRAEVRRGR